MALVFRRLITSTALLSGTLWCAPTWAAAPAAPASGAAPHAINANDTSDAPETPRDAYLARLIEALGHDDSFKVRLQAAVLLGRSKDHRALEPLLLALANDTHYTVRAAAATALGNLTELRSIVPLLQHMASDADPFVREESQVALKKFAPAVALPYVMAAFGSEDPAVRRQVIVHISHETPSQVEGVLIKALGDVPEVSLVAADTLTHVVAPDETLRILTNAVQNRDPLVRKGGVEVLHSLNSAAATHIILDVYERDMEVDEVRDATRDALRDLRRFLPMQDIVSEANSTDKQVRVRALKLLGVLGGDSAKESLTEALAADDPYIRGTAVMGLRDLGNPDVIPMLEKLAEDPLNQRILNLIRHTVKQLSKKRE